MIFKEADNYEEKKQKRQHGILAQPLIMNYTIQIGLIFLLKEKGTVLPAAMLCSICATIWALRL